MDEKQSRPGFRGPTPEAPAENLQVAADRRQGQQTYDGNERRQRGDRHGMPFGLKFTTTRGLTEIEDWLDENCRSGYHLAIEDMSEALDSKTVRIMFSSDEERQDFRRQFGAKQAVPPGA